MELLTDFEKGLKQRNQRLVASFKELSSQYNGASKTRIIKVIAKQEKLSEQTIRITLLKMGVIKKKEQKIKYLI